MKDKEKIFKLLREAVETPQESLAVEEMISKIEGIIPSVETVTDTKKTFKGINFYKDYRGNYVCSTPLHRFIWQYVNGEIPEGYEVHHRDFNHDNNDISNLQLLTREEHIAIHKKIKRKQPPREKEKFICVVCGREYEAVKTHSNKYCSEKCSGIAKVKMQQEIRVCLQCGKEYSTYKYGRQKFCSRECMFESMRKREVKICLFCGKEFIDKKVRNRKYCSQDCHHKAQRKK